MATSNEHLWKQVQVAEKEVQTALADKNLVLRSIDRLISQYRSTCEDVFLQDFEFAAKKNAENRLWDAHIKINNRFRKQLHVFRELAGKRKQVEQRKSAKHYLDFIKSSQRFYRGYILKLALRYGGIHELETVARRLNPDRVNPSRQRKGSKDLSREILRSCHQTLVRLGDLSRYRETELVVKDHNWGPAIGYYELASAIYPASGASHNQLAIIARVDANHLRATYHLYRALAVQEPPETAMGNLELEFKKIYTAWEKGELIVIRPSQNSQGPGKALVGWFMRLHARCYSGIEFTEHDELESEVLSQLAIDLKERSLEGTLNKFILINIAAEYFAGERLKAAPETVEVLNSFFFFQRLNVKTMFTLLQVLQPELERLVGNEDESSPDTLSTPRVDQISAVARRVLPGLRHYSSWLTTKTAVLVAQQDRETPLSIQIKELWKIYASTLTLLASTFPVAALPAIEYLLDEDEDTLGFKPFEDDRAIMRYNQLGSTTQKPKWHDEGVERYHPNLEMLGRIRGFLAEGLQLAVDETVPIDLLAGTTTFAYREKDMPSELQASPAGQRVVLSSTMIERPEISHTPRSPSPERKSRADEIVSQITSASISMNTEAHRMVDSLLDSENADHNSREKEPVLEVSYHIERPLLAPAFEVDPSNVRGNNTTYGYNTTFDASDFIHAAQKYSDQGPQASPRRHLPSIINSPFAPEAGETTPLARPGTAKITSAHHSQQNSQQTLPPLRPINGQLVESTMSSIVDPSSFSTPKAPINGHAQSFSRQQAAAMNGGYRAAINYGAVGRPVLRGNESSALFHESEFRSSEVYVGSSWACSGQSTKDALNMQTPPNGQEAG